MEEKKGIKPFIKAAVENSGNKYSEELGNKLLEKYDNNYDNIINDIGKENKVTDIDGFRAKIYEQYQLTPPTTPVVDSEEIPKIQDKARSFTNDYLDFDKAGHEFDIKNKELPKSQFDIQSPPEELRNQGPAYNKEAIIDAMPTLSKIEHTDSTWEGFGKELGLGATYGGNMLNQLLADAPDYLNRMITTSYNLTPIGRLQTDVGELIGKDWKMKALDLRSEKFADYTKDQQAIIRKKVAAVNPKMEEDILASAKNGDWITFTRNVSRQVAESTASSIAIMTAGAATGGVSMVGMGTVVFGAGKYREVDEAVPDMPEEKKVFIAGASGALEGLFETTFGSAAVGKAFVKLIANEGKDVAKGIALKGFRRGFSDLILKYPAMAPLGEGFEEWGTQITQNYVDKLSGYRPDIDVMEGSTQAFIIGAAAGASHGAIIRGARIGQDAVKVPIRRSKVKKQYEKSLEYLGDIPNSEYTDEIKKATESISDPYELSKAFDEITKNNKEHISEEDYQKALFFVSSFVQHGQMNNSRDDQIDENITKFQDNNGNVSKATIDGKVWYILNPQDIATGKVIFAKNEAGETKGFANQKVTEAVTKTPDEIRNDAIMQDEFLEQEAEKQKAIQDEADAKGIVVNQTAVSPHGKGTVISINENGTVTIADTKGDTMEVQMNEVEQFKTTEQKAAEKEQEQAEKDAQDALMEGIEEGAEIESDEEQSGVRIVNFNNGQSKVITTEKEQVFDTPEERDNAIKVIVETQIADTKPSLDDLSSEEAFEQLRIEDPESAAEIFQDEIKEVKTNAKQLRTDSKKSKSRDEKAALLKQARQLEVESQRLEEVLNTKPVYENPISGLINTPVYDAEGNVGTIKHDGQILVFETGETILELGNADAIGHKDMSSFGLTNKSPLAVEVTSEKEFTIGEEGYTLVEVKQDSEGNAIVKAKDSKGLIRRIKGQQAEIISKDIALAQEKTKSERQQTAFRAAETTKTITDEKPIEQVSQVEGDVLQREDTKEKVKRKRIDKGLAEDVVLDISDKASEDINVKKRGNAKKALVKIANEFGIPIKVIHSSEISEGAKRKQRISGATPDAYYEDGVAYIISDQITSVSHAKESYLHESILHKGLDILFDKGSVALLGKEYKSKNELLMEMFNRMDEKTISDKAKEYGIAMEEGTELTDKQKVEISEEVLATLNQMENMPSRLKVFIDSLWKKIKKLAGFTSNQFTQNDFLNLLSEHRRLLKEVVKQETISKAAEQKLAETDNKLEKPLGEVSKTVEDKADIQPTRDLVEAESLQKVEPTYKGGEQKVKFRAKSEINKLKEDNKATVYNNIKINGENIERKFNQIIPNDLKDRYNKLKDEGYSVEAHSTTTDGLLDDLSKDEDDFEGTISVSTIGSAQYIDKGSRTIYVIVAGTPIRYAWGDIGSGNMEPKNTPYDEIYLEKPSPQGLLIPKYLEGYDYWNTLINSVVVMEIYEHENQYFGDIISESNKNLRKDIRLIDSVIYEYYENNPDEIDNYNDWAYDGVPSEIIDKVIKKNEDIRFRAQIKSATANIGTFDPESADIRFRVDQAASEIDTNPSEEQIHAGNYKMGHVAFDGFDISIENPKGSTRSGKDQDGKEWSREMPANYGYFKGTIGKDKDHIDVFIGDNPESDKVYVIDQIDTKTGKFDEHKVILGTNNISKARILYNSAYEEGWTGLGQITRTDKAGLKEWFKGDTKKPYSGVKFRTDNITIKKLSKSKPQDVEKDFDKNKEIKVYRTIFAENIKDIDFSNIGIHWTSDHNYQHVKNYESELKEQFRTKKRRARLTAIFNKDDQNSEASKYSNEQYPDENEIILNKDSSPTHLDVQFDNKSGILGSWKYIDDRYLIAGDKVNSGDRQDEWVDNTKFRITEESTTPEIAALFERLSALEKVSKATTKITELEEEKRVSPTFEKPEIEKQIKDFKEGVKAGTKFTKDKINEIESTLIDYIGKNLDLGEAGARDIKSAFTAIKKARTPKSIQKAFDKIDELTGKVTSKATKNKHVAHIKRLMKWMKNTDKFVYANNVEFKKFRETDMETIKQQKVLNSPNSTEEQKIAADNELNRMWNELDTKVDERTMLENVQMKLIEYRRNKAEASDELVASIREDLQIIYDAAKDAGKDESIQKAIDRKSDREFVKGTLGKPMKELSENKQARMFTDNIAANSMGNWETVLTMLGGYKLRDKFTMIINQVNQEVATQATFDKVLEEVRGIYGFKKKIQLESHLNKMNKEEYTLRQANREGELGEGDDWQLSTHDLIDIYNAIKNKNIQRSYYFHYGDIVSLEDANGDAELARKMQIDDGEARITSLLSNLTKQDKEFGDIMQRVADAYYSKYNKVFIAQYNRDLKKNDNYWPSTAESTKENDAFERFKQDAVQSSATKERANDRVPVPSNAFKKFAKHIKEGEWYDNMALDVHRMSKIIENMNVRKRIESARGEAFYETVQYHLAEQGMNPPSKGVGLTDIEKGADWLLNNWVAAAVGLTPSVPIKQTLSSINYVENMPPLEWMARFVKNIPKLRGIWKEMMKIPYLPVRLKQGYSEAVQQAIANNGGTSWLAIAHKNMKKGLTIGTRYFDMYAIVYGGKPYLDYLQKTKGLSHDDAVIQFLKDTLRVQQSPLSTTLGKFQHSKNPAKRALFSFSNTPSQYNRKLIETNHAYQHGDISKRQVAKVYTIYLALASINYVVAGAMIRAILKGSDWDDDIVESIISQTIVSLVGGVPYVKDATEVGSRLVTGQKVYDDINPLLDLSGKVLKNGYAFFDAEDNDKKRKYATAFAKSLSQLLGISGNNIEMLFNATVFRSKTFQEARTKKTDKHLTELAKPKRLMDIDLKTGNQSEGYLEHQKNRPEYKEAESASNMKSAYSSAKRKAKEFEGKGRSDKADRLTKLIETSKSNLAKTEYSSMDIESELKQFNRMLKIYSK